ncbi:hypothetical protein C5167_007729, partial [Papaver somniferum]
MNFDIIPLTLQRPSFSLHRLSPPSAFIYREEKKGNAETGCNDVRPSFSRRDLTGYTPPITGESYLKIQNGSSGRNEDMGAASILPIYWV